MKKKKFTHSQIAFALKLVETGTRVAEICRRAYLKPLFTTRRRNRWFGSE